MFRRIAARLVTGPLAFALGGVIDILGYGAVSLRARVRSARRAPGSGPLTHTVRRLSTIWRNEGW